MVDRNTTKDMVLNCKITQGFAENANSFYKEQGLEGHTGIDYACGYKTPVVCEWDKEHVYKVFTPAHPASDGFTGIFTIVEQDGEVFEFLYGHIGGIKVKEGQTITRGQIIATEGNYGQVFQNGAPCTPERKLNGCGSHRHYQKRPIRLIERTNPLRAYLRHPTQGMYRYGGKYCEIRDYWNGYHGCVPFQLPSQEIEEVVDTIAGIHRALDNEGNPATRETLWDIIKEWIRRLVLLN